MPNDVEIWIVNTNKYIRESLKNAHSKSNERGIKRRVKVDSYVNGS